MTAVATCEQTAAVLAWAMADGERERAVKIEREKRDAVMSACFPEAAEGTNTLALEDGRHLKAVVKVGFRLDAAKVEAALAKLRKLGETGELLAKRLVKFRPELAVGEWRKLEDKHRRLFAGVVSTSACAPSLELVEPKV